MAIKDNDPFGLDIDTSDDVVDSDTNAKDGVVDTDNDNDDDNLSQEELRKLNTPDLPVNKVAELELHPEDNDDVDYDTPEEGLKAENDRRKAAGSSPGMPVDPHDPALVQVYSETRATAQPEDDAAADETHQKFDVEVEEGTTFPVNASDKNKDEA